MRNFYQGFILLDMSNTTRHLRQKFPDVRHYGDADYDRLEWLEVTMPMYLEDVKRSCGDPSEFLTKETYEAIFYHHLL
ncbi:hypothetical protein HPB48_018581 [Haemaphysalis longicornis]|uniref:Uncharacterized protein n=1 Tax=Haemaphysalis longicornis TaxID=44386 RepID=A0A9J6G5L8_HAELO|nr:hypothetical protein HPB48_018581 [Haemaphysalis longicornis]